MSLTLVDSNVILDLIQEDPAWYAWSSKAVQDCSQGGALAINPIILAELSMGFDRPDDLDETVSPAEFLRLNLPWEAAFVAGKCFLKYRRQGGTRRSPLPDFYIGAHAAVSGLQLLTRDAKRYKNYFPKLRIIAP